MTAYVPPEWATGGQNVYGLSLEVIKSGVILDTVALDAKPFFVAGRMEPLCDLVLQHPSVSRTHAALQFDADGKLFVVDLKSTHGTHVNKRRLPPSEYTQLYVGDVVVFGESTRIYTILGPPELMPDEYNSTNLEKLRASLAEKKRPQKKPRACEDGISWGFGEDAEEEDDADHDDSSDDEASDKHRPPTTKTARQESLPDYLRDRKDVSGPYVSSVSKESISAKDTALYTRLQARMHKMENLRTESERIRAKQGMGLTDGQQAALDKNEARIAQLQEEIQTIEATLQAKQTQRLSQKAQLDAKKEASATKAATKAKTSTTYDDDDDDDDFYDRTKAHAAKKHVPLSAAPRVLTADSIRANLRALTHQLETIQAQYKKNEAAAATTLDASTDGDDSLDAYLQASNAALVADQRTKLQAETTRLQGLIAEQEKLLAIATPALDKVVEKPLPVAFAPDAEAAPVVAPVAKQVVAPVAVTESAADPQLPARPSTSPFNAPVAVQTTPSRATVLSESSPTPLEEPVRTVRSLEPEGTSQKKRAVPSTEPKPKRQRPNATKPAKVFDDGVLEGGESVWQPPANQTGDGRTALNDKYGY